jgi:hypothetical protein
MTARHDGKTCRSFGVGVTWMPTAESTDFPNAAVTVPVEGMEPIPGVQISPYDASGSQLIKAPEWMVNASLSYVAPLMGGEFAGHVNYSYNSEFNWQAGDLTESPSRNLVNARLACTDPSDRYTFSRWRLCDPHLVQPTGLWGIIAR